MRKLAIFISERLPFTAAAEPIREQTVRHLKTKCGELLKKLMWQVIIIIA